jgi:E3 ubiquitin-protein ligase RNF115/126
MVREAREAFSERALQDAIDQSRRAYLLSELPREPYSRERHGNVATECELCLEEYAEKDELVRLPCMHIFHAACASPWLLKSGTCPVCLTELDQTGTVGAETTQDSSGSSGPTEA